MIRILYRSYKLEQGGLHVCLEVGKNIKIYLSNTCRTHSGSDYKNGREIN